MAQLNENPEMDGNQNPCGFISQQILLNFPTDLTHTELHAGNTIVLILSHP